MTTATAGSGVDLEVGLRPNQQQVQGQAEDPIVCEITRRPSGPGAALLVAAAAALLGGGLGYPRRPRADQRYGEAPTPRVPDHFGLAHIEAAKAKRARRAAKRLRTAEGAAPGDDVDKGAQRLPSRFTPQQAGTP